MGYAKGRIKRVFAVNSLLMIYVIGFRGRTHPEEVLSVLAEVQCDPDKKIRDMVVHVSYML